MGNTQTLMTQIYSAFNRRDIDGVLTLMSEKVDDFHRLYMGIKLSPLTRPVSPDLFFPDYPAAFRRLRPIDREGGKTDVKVHQLVQTLNGDVLSDQEVWHIYTITNGLIERMDVNESEPSFTRAPHANAS